MNDTLKTMIKKLAGIVLPVKRNKILFINFNGRGYGCNPKYIAQELINRSTKYDLVWLVSNIDEEMPKEIRKVQIKSWRAKIELLTSKIWVFNVRNYKGVDKKKNQYYIQTWHSSIGLKKVEGDIKDFPENSKKESMYDGKITDLMFANNQFRYEQIRRAFWYKGTLLKCGVPRNAILFNTPETLNNKVRTRYNISENTMIILYAPTFREKSEVEAYVWNYDKIRDAVEQKYKKKAIILLRLHPYVIKQSDKIRFNDKVINASDYPDMQELLAISDILISDFSSCAFDFSFAHKPVFLFAKDKQKYLETERELLIDIDDLPYGFSENEEELAQQITGFSETDYENACSAFFDRIGLYEDGMGAKRVVDWIEQKIKE